MLYLLLALLSFNTAVVWFLAWNVIDYLKWKRQWRENNNV